MKVLSVFGTRPEAVKMAPVIRELERAAGIDSFICVTAQHRRMLDQVLNIFEIRPDIDLDLMREDQSLSALSARIFGKLDKVLDKIRPDWLLVQGDTTTVAIASLVAYYHRLRVGHVEAGLRTHDKWQPYPEEINRRLAGVIADLHFAPTEWARRNLLDEGVDDSIISVTGNPVIDALQIVAEKPITKEVSAILDRLHIRHGAGGKRLILVTAHRRESFGSPLENVCAALISLASRGDVEIVYPVHLNPNVSTPVHRLLDGLEHITLLEPLDYLPFVQLMKNATLVLTDSGGMQEEAPALGVPCLVMRDITERPEGVDAGVLKLVGTDPRTIASAASQLLDDPAAYAAMASVVNPFGDGRAAERIVSKLLQAA